MKKLYFWICLSVLVLCIVSMPLQAKTKSFAMTQLKTLEQQLQTKYGVEGLAQRMTVLHDATTWQKELDSQLKLYTVAQWIDRGFISDASHLLSSTPAPEGLEDLYHHYQIVVWIYSNQSVRAGLLLNQLESKYPEDSNILYLKSMFLADQNQINEAISVLDQIIQRDARDGRAYLQRGVYHLVAMSPDKALKDFESAIRKLPKSDIPQRQQAYLQAGIIYIRFKMNGKKGEEYLKKGMALDPQSELVAQVKNALR